MADLTTFRAADAAAAAKVGLIDGQLGSGVGRRLAARRS
jgi:hypothetical protein